MSVNITYFHDTATSAGNSAEVLAWLQANATDYFDDFSVDSDNKILCKLNDGNDQKTVLTIPTSSTSNLANGSMQSLLMESEAFLRPCHSSTSGCISRACVTPYGIALRYLSLYDTQGSTGSSAGIIYVTKSDQGSTCIMSATAASTSYPNQLRYRFCDLVYSEQATDLASNLNSNTFDFATLRKLFKAVSITGKTTLTPVCFDRGTYAPNLFLTTFANLDLAAYEDFEEVDIDGTRYLYDGYVALKG